MSDKITTLHLKNDPSTNIYPNVKMENIPLDVTIAQGGANLATSGTIYEFTTSRFLSLTGGTMKGAIMTGGFTKPEEATLGDGLDVFDLSSPANPTTHYGSGYIRQDDDEDSSIKYHYKFPKENGTFITDNWLGFSEYVKESEEITFTPVEDSNVTINFSHIVKHGNIVFVHIGVTINVTSTGNIKIGELSTYPNHIHNNLAMSTQAVDSIYSAGFGYAALKNNGEIYIYNAVTGSRYFDYNTFFTIGE